MYQKEIIYLHLFDGEIRGNCVGYLKTEKKQDRHYLELQVKNLPKEMTGGFPIRLQSESGWKEADTLMIKEGSGKWAGTSEEQVQRVEILVSRMKTIKGESKYTRMFAEVREETAFTDNKKEKKPSEKNTGKESVKEQAEKVSAEGQTEKVAAEEKTESTGGEKDETKEAAMKAADKGKTIVAAERAYAPQPFIRGERAGKTERTAKAERTTKPEHMPLYENKWEQLMSTYEQIHPYGDNRIYVKLQPKDFIILRENYQHLVNNSFLLHGFYNYRYLILGKENGFYLGVPGVFYEREKMVALMFGFEAFECEGGEAEEGKFGYYLRKVEL